MKKMDLEVKERTEIGSRKSKRLRLGGLVPGVVYGKSKESVIIAVNSKDLRKTLSTEAGKNVIINLVIKGNGKSKEESVITHDIERDPLTGEYIHVDLMIIDMNKPVEAEIPVHVVGDAPGAKAGGVLLLRYDTVRVKCLPDLIPGHFDVNVSHLEINQGIMIKDLDLPQGVVIIHPEPEDKVVVVEPPRAEEVPVETAEELAEPEIVGAKGKLEEEGGEGEEKPEAEKPKEKEKETPKAEKSEEKPKGKQ